MTALIGFVIGLAVGLVLGVTCTLVYSAEVARWVTRNPEE